MIMVIMSKSTITLTEEHVKELAHDAVLGILSVTSKPKNYSILEMAPTTANEIMETLGTTRVQTYRLIRAMERHGVIRLERGTGKVVRTEVGDLTFTLVSQMINLTCGQMMKPESQKRFGIAIKSSF